MESSESQRRLMGPVYCFILPAAGGSLVVAVLVLVLLVVVVAAKKKVGGKRNAPSLVKQEKTDDQHELDERRQGLMRDAATQAWARRRACRAFLQAFTLVEDAVR